MCLNFLQKLLADGQFRELEDMPAVWKAVKCFIIYLQYYYIQLLRSLFFIIAPRQFVETKNQKISLVLMRIRPKPPIVPFNIFQMRKKKRKLHLSNQNFLSAFFRIYFNVPPSNVSKYFTSNHYFKKFSSYTLSFNHYCHRISNFFLKKPVDIKLRFETCLSQR